MLHLPFMPSREPKRERPRPILLFACLILWCFALAGFAANAADRPRVASINVCTDQMLLVLADPEQIVGLSPYSRDATRSWAADRARAFPRLSGEAEDVLVAKPDLVVAGRFTKRATRELLKQKGLRVVEFDAARSLDDAKAQIRLMGELLGHPERGQAEIARLDAAVERARAAVARTRLRVLPLSRRGWVSGGEGLTASLLAATGLAHAGRELGFRAGGFAPLEAIVSLKPDLILVADEGSFAEDQGRAFLLHPAIEKLYPPERRLVIPERLTVCGGPMLAEALDRLTAEIERVRR
jgi:iron complex transport system substrate-binding protein